MGCYAYRPQTPLQPTTFRACRAVIKWLGSHDKQRGLITFSRRPGFGYRVPDQWVGGNCWVGIDMHTDDDVDTLSFRDIGFKAYMIALACVITPPHLGGTLQVGPKGVMNVSIWGYDRRSSGFEPLTGPNGNKTQSIDERSMLDEKPGGNGAERLWQP